eukprot:4947976-Prymnesium_polylepis.1
MIPHIGAPVSISIGLILCGRMADQLSGGLEPTLRAYMADCSEAPADGSSLTTDERIGHYMGRLQAAFGLGVSLGAVGGGLLGEAYGVLPPQYAALAATSTCVLLALGLPHRPPSPASAAAADKPSMLALLQVAAQTRAVAVLLLLRFLTGVAFSMYITTDQRMLKERFNLGPETYGFYMLTTGVLFALTNGALVPWAVQKLPQRRLLVASLAVLALARAVQATSTSLTVAYAGTALGAVGGGSCGCLIASLLANQATEAERGWILGLSESVDKSTGIISPLLGGILYDQFGNSAPAFAASGVTLLACASAVVGLASSAKDKAE